MLLYEPLPWSGSSPIISESTAYSLVSLLVINPIAIPETGVLTLIPESINAIEPAQTVAIEDDPLDSRISETTRIVYKFSSSLGKTFFKALISRLPCPTSLLPGPLLGLTSPVEKLSLIFAQRLRKHLGPVPRLSG